MEATPWKVDYKGQEQVGEVVLTSVWQPALAQVPAQLAFRIVLFTRPLNPPFPFVDDPRLCLCLPRGPLGALRERRSPYQVVGERGEEYSLGQVITASGSLPLPGLVFSLPQADKRLNLLAKVTLCYSEAVEKLASPRRLAEFLPTLQEMIEVMAYLEGAEVTSGDLAMDRTTIQAQLALASLIENPQLWSSIKALFRWFKQRYSTGYEAFHSRYHQEMASLKQRLEAAAPQLRALTWLNSIAELGEPLGQELNGEYQALLARVAPCLVAEVRGEEVPWCSKCGLSLDSQPPRQEVAALEQRLQAVLRQQQHRLSQQASSLILSQSHEERVDRFIKLIQSSDPTPLVQVLNEELVDFLRQLLREARIYIFSLPLFQELTAKFPYLEEGDVEMVVKEFEQLLQAAFARARGERPGQPLRLALIGEDEAHRRPGKPGTDIRSQPA